MAEPIVYSERLGAIADEQFAAATERLGLGRFLAATPITAGLFGQNVFLRTSEGEYVLRGAPHWVRGPEDTTYRPQDRWQFSKEAYFINVLHDRTKAPVPFPYLRDETSDIFGWPYAIMPRMPGACYDDQSIRAALNAENQTAIAAALGAMLAEMQSFTVPHAGDVDIDTIAFTPSPIGAAARIIKEAENIAVEATANGALTADDHAWIDAAIARARAAPTRPNTYLHCDYKLNNLTVLQDAKGWRVSGIFDFHEAQFGDGALDLVRQACSYLEADRALAAAFIAAYRDAAGIAPELAELMPLYIINDRLKIWTYFTRPGQRHAFTEGKTFRQWAEFYAKGILALL